MLWRANKIAASHWWNVLSFACYVLWQVSDVRVRGTPGYTASSVLFACRSYPDEAILADLQTLNILVLKTLRNITACDTSRVTLIFFFLLLCTFPWLHAVGAFLHLIFFSLCMLGWCSPAYCSGYVPPAAGSGARKLCLLWRSTRKFSTHFACNEMTTESPP